MFKFIGIHRPMKTILYITLLSFFGSNQEFDAERYLNGQWCKKNTDTECFTLTYDQGLLLFEIPDGGYIEGVEVIKYDESERKIFWKIVGTNKDTQNFKIIDNDNVIYFDGVTSSYWQRTK